MAVIVRRHKTSTQDYFRRNDNIKRSNYSSYPRRTEQGVGGVEFEDRRCTLKVFVCSRVFGEPYIDIRWSHMLDRGIIGIFIR